MFRIIYEIEHILNIFLCIRKKPYPIKDKHENYLIKISNQSLIHKL